MSPFPTNRIAEHRAGRSTFQVKPKPSGDTLLAGAQRIVIEALRLGDGEVLTEFRLEGTVTESAAAELLATFTKGGAR